MGSGPAHHRNTLGDSMKVYVGNQVFDSITQPIVIRLDTSAKKMIAEMKRDKFYIEYIDAHAVQKAELLKKAKAHDRSR